MALGLIFSFTKFVFIAGTILELQTQIAMGEEAMKTEAKKTKPIIVVRKRTSVDDEPPQDDTSSRRSKSPPRKKSKQLEVSTGDKTTGPGRQRQRKQQHPKSILFLFLLYNY